MTIDEQRTRVDAIQREIYALNAEEREEMKKETPDLFDLHLIAQERERLEDELENL